jgi:hypothetical protein
VSQAYENREPRAGWSTVDPGSRRRVRSPELTLPGGFSNVGSPGWLQHEEGQAGNLTEGFTVRLIDRVMPAAVDSGGGDSCSVHDGVEHKEAILGVARGVAVSPGVRGAFPWTGQ